MVHHGMASIPESKEQKGGEWVPKRIRKKGKRKGTLILKPQ